MVVTATSPGRVPGVDAVRAIAIAGVVAMNYHAYLNPRLAWRPLDPSLLERAINPMTGPLTTRFAATFVLVAGVGISLFTWGRDDLARRRIVLLRRGLLLYGAGAVLNWVWPGTILFFYGAYFMVAALICGWKTRRVIAVGAVSAVAAAAIESWRTWRELGGYSTAWLSPKPDGPRNLMLRTLVDYTHPLLPWLAFLCIGIVIGRYLGTIVQWRSRVAVTAAAVLATVVVVRTVVRPDGDSDAAVLVRAALSTDPYDRGLLFTASAGATALLAFLLVTAFVYRDGPLARAGRMSLSMYMGHVFFFHFFVDWLKVVPRESATAALVLSAAYLAPALSAAAWWSRVHGAGPVERAYRTLGGG
jgi:uncharacterized membrane protein YeiB